VAVVVTLLAQVTAYGGIDGGGGEIAVVPPTNCITAADHALAAQLIADYIQNHGPLSAPQPGKVPPKLAFEPIGGRLCGDVFTINYVDLSATASTVDWDCMQYTYDGHAGHDTMIRTFDEQQIGVPVFAAFDGVVVAAHDGEPDMNTGFQDVPANFVIIDHGLGRLGKYWHLKMGSVLVAPGHVLAAGESIGLVGSSGMSSGPHLHFEISDEEQVVEAYAGDCRAGETGWVLQPLPVRDVFLHDLGLTPQNLSALPGWPHRWPSTGQIALSDAAIRVWFYGANLPAGSSWRIDFRDPNGVLYSPLGEQFFQNSFWKWFSWWWTYDVPQMHVLAGTWHVMLSINDELMVEAPVEVVAVPSPASNSPPEPITLTFEPPAPKFGDALAARVNTSRILDDLDYDVVRFHYRWLVDGEVVREVTTAAQSDVLQRDLLKSGGVATCEVTPMDDVSAGETTVIASHIAEPPVPTVGAWGMIILLGCVAVAGTLIVARRRWPDPMRPALS
jgi:hypothetical protein